MCERELSLAQQEAEGSSRSGQALSSEMHSLARQNAALQHQVASLQAQLEETLDGRQAEVGLQKEKPHREMNRQQYHTRKSGLALFGKAEEASCCLSCLQTFTSSAARG